MLKTFQPNELWKIATWETPEGTRTFEYLSKMHKAGNWDKVPPAWVELNLGFNGLFNLFLEIPLFQRFKPYVLYNGHHRLKYAKKYELPFKAYVKWTPNNPAMPEGEKRYPLNE